jgi:hypothetical protein
MTYLFGKLFCLIIEVGFHQSKRIDTFHIAENKENGSKHRKMGWKQAALPPRRTC